MKSLSLLRHAEAEQPIGMRDFDRSLSSYGAQMAPRFGRRLEQQGFMPDLVFASPAARAVETARIMCYEIGYPEESLVLKNGIYRASLEGLLQVIQEASESAQHLLLVGHNPALGELAAYLCAQNPASKPVLSHMATCALLRIQLPIEYWALIESGVGLFQDYDTPENL